MSTSNRKPNFPPGYKFYGNTRKKITFCPQDNLRLKYDEIINNRDAYENKYQECIKYGIYTNEFLQVDFRKKYDKKLVKWEVYTISCYYTFEKTCFILGSVGHDQVLNILDWYEIVNTPSHEVQDLLIEQVRSLRVGFESQRKTCIGINCNFLLNINSRYYIENLKAHYNKLEDVNFYIPDIESDSTFFSDINNDLIKSLNYKEKIKYPPDFPLGQYHLKECFLLMINFFRPRLTSKFTEFIRYKDIWRGGFTRYFVDRLPLDPDWGNAYYH